MFVMTLFVAFTPIITAMILNGSGISQAGGIIATMGANYVMNLPKNITNSMASVATGGAVGRKMKLAQTASGVGFKFAKKAVGLKNSKQEESKQNFTQDSGRAGGSNNTNSSNNVNQSKSASKFSMTNGGSSQSASKNFTTATTSSNQAQSVSSNRNGHANKVMNASWKSAVLPAEKQITTLSKASERVNYQRLNERRSYGHKISERGRRDQRSKQTT